LADEHKLLKERVRRLEGAVRMLLRFAGSGLRNEPEYLDWLREFGVVRPRD
jgi:hypothetical protein